MNDYSFLVPRARKKHLFVVEGEHEKDNLFNLILKCFPEIDIDIDNIIVYGTNIYNLYQDIVNEYGVDWKDNDVDLPYLVSSKKGISPPYKKRDFNNILLVFDYERHHPRFDEAEITALQTYFNDMAGTGQLYLNYPMIESYRHFKTLPDPDYEFYSECSSMEIGNIYKNKTQEVFTFVHSIVSFPKTLKHQLKTRFDVANDVLIETCVSSLLEINRSESLLEKVRTILEIALSDPKLTTATYYITHLIQKLEYTNHHQSYFDYARWLFQQIAVHNIRKAHKIQNGIYQFPAPELKANFLSLDFNKVVELQNDSSRDIETGVVWVLNTCILFIPEYDFGLLDDGSL